MDDIIYGLAVVSIRYHGVMVVTTLSVRGQSPQSRVQVKRVPGESRKLSEEPYVSLNIAIALHKCFICV